MRPVSGVLFAGPLPRACIMREGRGTLATASGVSADGATIVGFGQNQPTRAYVNTPFRAVLLLP